LPGRRGFKFIKVKVKVKVTLEHAIEDYHNPIGMNRAKNSGYECHIFIALEINK